MLRVLGVTGTVRSPTYTLVERYPLAGQREAVHLDLYRIAAADELQFLGLDDLTEHAGLWLIEWPEHGIDAIPPPDLTLTLSHAGDGRSARLEPAGSTGRAWLDRVVRHVHG